MLGKGMGSNPHSRRHQRPGLGKEVTQGLNAGWWAHDGLQGWRSEYESSRSGGASLAGIGYLQMTRANNAAENVPRTAVQMNRL